MALAAIALSGACVAWLSVLIVVAVAVLAPIVRSRSKAQSKERLAKLKKERDAELAEEKARLAALARADARIAREKALDDLYYETIARQRREGREAGREFQRRLFEDNERRD
jgi:hypothetical protein